MNKSKLIAAFAIVLWWISSSASASTVYGYTGSAFTERSGMIADYYTHLTISLTFDQPLAPSSVYNGHQPGPTNWSIDDGAVFFGPSTSAYLSFCMLLTNDSGNIIWWLVDATLSTADGTQFEDTSFTLSDAAGVRDSPFGNAYARINYSTPGVWTINGVAPPEPASTPEPASFVLVLGGLAAGAVFGRRTLKQ